VLPNSSHFIFTEPAKSDAVCKEIMTPPFHVSTPRSH
jgi:hypothetical protein